MMYYPYDNNGNPCTSKYSVKGLLVDIYPFIVCWRRRVDVLYQAQDDMLENMGNNKPVAVWRIKEKDNNKH